MDEEDDGFSNPPTTAGAEASIYRGNSEEVAVGIKEMELRQLHKSRQLELNIRNSRSSIPVPGAAVDDSWLPESADAQNVLRQSRDQAIKDLRQSGHLLARLLRESGYDKPSGSEAVSEGRGKSESSEASPDRPPQKREKENGKETENESESDNEKGDLGDMVVHKSEEKGKEQNHTKRDPLLLKVNSPGLDKRFVGCSTLQEQINSSGELDLDSPVFRRRAQRQQAKAFEIDYNEPRSPTLPTIRIESSEDSRTRQEQSAEPSRAQLKRSTESLRSGEQQCQAKSSTKAPEKRPLKQSKQLLQIALHSKRERSRSLSVVPQQATAEPAKPSDNTAAIPQASAATPVPPLLSPDEHTKLKKRERTGSFNIPMDRFMVRKEKKFFYKGRELRYHLTPFGGGCGMCPGRFFARNELKLWIAFMIYFFEIELLPTAQCVPLTSR